MGRLRNGKRRLSLVSSSKAIKRPRGQQQQQQQPAQHGPGSKGKLAGQKGAGTIKKKKKGGLVQGDKGGSSAAHLHRSDPPPRQAIGPR